MKTCKKRRLRLESLEQRQLLAAHPFETDVQLLQRSHTNDNWYLGGTRQYLSDENPSQDWTPMVSGDFTADGMTDVLGTVAGQWWLQVNDGTQLFGLPWGESPLNETELIGTRDFNNDGWLDVMSRDVATGNFLLSKNSADGFTVEQWGGWTTAVQWSNITIRDFDNDGLLDVLGSEPGGNWWLAKNNGTRSYNHHWGKYQLFDWQDIVEGDFNGDQFGDMASRGPDNTWRVWFGTDSGFQVPEYRGHWKVRNEWHDVMAADFDGDGRDDLIGRSDDGLLWVATSLEDRFQTRKWATGWIESAEWANVKLVDVDDDGMIDQVGQANDGTFWVAKNDGQKMRNHFWGRAEGTPEFVDYVADFESTTALDVAAFFPGGGVPPLRPRSVATTDADLYVSLSADNRLVVTTMNGPLQLVGIDIHSESGSLIPIPGGDSAMADPFSFILSNTSEQITIGSVGTAVVFEGSTTLNVGWKLDAVERDLWVQYGELAPDDGPIPAWVDPSLSGIDEEAAFVAQSIDYAELNRRNYQRILSQLG